MNHAPAPWLIVDAVPCSEIGYRAVLDADGFTICDPSPMGEANARLIACAPDLLAALIELVSEHDARNANDDHRSGYTQDTGGIAWARELIAKATN